MRSDLHASVATSLRTVDQRYTAGRRQIVQALARAARPLTVAELLDAAGDLAQSSAYRNLAILERAGTVRRIQGADEFARFELAEHLTEHHHHLVCTRCGEVVDVTLAGPLERVIDTAVEEISASTGFAAEGHRLDIIGVCAACSRRAARASSPLRGAGRDPV